MTSATLDVLNTIAAALVNAHLSHTTPPCDKDEQTVFDHVNSVTKGKLGAKDLHNCMSVAEYYFELDHPEFAAACGYVADVAQDLT